MTTSHDELREALGSYVLGQLEGDLLHAVEDHLSTCEECRAVAADLAPLVAPLRAVDPDVVTALAGPVPATLDDRVEAALRAEAVGGATVTRLPGRARRWVPVAAGVLAGAAAAAAVTVAVLPDPPAGAPVLAVRQVTTAPGVTATAGLVDHTWGVELKLVATGLPAGRAYDVRIVDDGGREYDSGAFLGVDRTITCSMNASVLLADAARFEVLDPAGAVVISGPIAS